MKNRKSIKSVVSSGSICLATFVLVCSAASPVLAIPFARYQFTEIANTRGAIRSFGTASINDDGTIAIVASFDDNKESVLTFNSAGVQSTIADQAMGFSNFDGRLGKALINNNGMVTFGANISGNFGVFASLGGVFTKIVDSGTLSIDGGVITRVIERDFSANDNNDVAFRALLDNGKNGVYQGNVAGGPLSKRIEASTAEFGFGSPVINNRNHLAVQTFFVDSNRTIRRYQIQSSTAGIFADSDAGFDAAALPGPGPEKIDMNNRDNTIFTAELDSGVRGIFTVTTQPVSTFVDNSGPFEILSDASINDHNGVVFLGSADVGGGRGLYNGPSITGNKIIAVGDVLGITGNTARTVSGLDLSLSFGTDALNNRRQLAFTFVDQNGDQYLFRADLKLDVDVDNLPSLVQVTNGMGNKPAHFCQLIHPNTRDGLGQLVFDYRFLTGGASLLVKLNDFDIGNIVAPEVLPDGLSHAVIPISLRDLYGGDLPPNDLLLSFFLEGGEGQSVQLDNISLFDLFNGDFAKGDLTGWMFDGGETGAALVTNGFDPELVPEPSTTAPVPEPSTTAPVLMGIAAASVLLRRRART